MLNSISKSFTLVSSWRFFIWPFVTTPVFLSLATTHVENALENEIVLSCPVVSDADRANLQLYSVANQVW
jgi:hypothetical protein